MIRINLLKTGTTELKEATAAPSAPKVKTQNPANLVFLILIIGLGAFYFFQQKAFDRENRLLTKAREEKTQLQYVEARLQEQRLVRESLDKKISLIESLNAQRDLAPRLLDELSRRLPDWVWLTEITYDAKGLQIKGRALSNNLIADYISSLESSPQLMNVTLVSSTQRTLKADQYLEFTLRSMIERKPAEAAPSKAGPAAKPAGKKPAAKEEKVEAII